MLLDELGLPSLDEATFSVDALVADSPFDEFIGFDHASRSSTPSVPPGFGFLPTQPSAVPGEEPIAKPTSRIVPTSAPFTPSRSASFYPRAATPLSNVSVPATPRAAPSSMVETPTSQAKQEVQQLASSSGLSKAIASQASQPALQSEDFPALQTSKGKTPIAPAAVKSMSSAKSGALPATTKKQSAGVGTAPSTQASAKGADTRAASGLNISFPAKAKASAPVSASTDSASKPFVAPAAFPPLPTSTTAPSIQSPLARNVAKSLRVTATPKTETPSGGSATPTSVTSMFAPTFPPSRQASMASVSRLDRPGSPTSEAVSDNASITSASMSRASSPPLTKVGSAPVRATTKSMQKKQRKEAQKEKERTEIEATVAKVEPEVEIAPIMGRKKKQKKDRSLNTATGGSTPTASRPQSPTPTESAAEDLVPSIDTPQQPAQASMKQTSEEADAETLARTTGESKGKNKAKAQQSASPEALTIAEVEEEASDKPIPTAVSIFQDLVKSGALGDVNTLSLLRQPSYSYRHQETTIDMQSANQKLTITPEDREALLKGRPVHKVKEGPHRIMLTPNGDCVRNLTLEEERRYLELQARLAKANGPTAFYSAKHHASNGFTLIGGRAVPNGPPSFFPTLNSTNTPMDPVSKIQRDEALSYINQYVLPSLSTNSQLEKALNANALETEILRSGDASAWASWGTDPATPHPTNNDAKYVNREGILANGLESMTAHFAVGGDINRGQPLGNVSLLSLSDAETALQIARKETEGFEKKLHALIKKNRRLLLGSGS
jgi:CCR4-NOT transcription complex subunit 4